MIEDPSDLLFAKVKQDIVKDDVWAALAYLAREGYTFEGKRYALLGYTESHLKEGTFVFLHETPNMSAKRLLRRLGDLQKVYLKDGCGKYAARLGLSFSSTLEGPSITDENVIRIHDKYAPDGSMYTDGSGLIKASFAQDMCAGLGLPLDTSIFQIRHGGKKGLLVAYPDRIFNQIVGPSNGRDKLIAYRSSMMKCDSDLTKLEIGSISSPRGCARLNVQFIILLLTRGISMEIFRDLMREQLDRLSSFLRDRDTAIDILRASGSADQRADGQGFYQELYEMLLAGQSLDEPYVKCQMARFHKTRCDVLKKKLSIDVPNSVRAKGVPDELNVLREDEVYLNLPGRTGIVLGKVVVSRNPAYHPGDLRILNAVNKPELAHIRHGIIFSSKSSHSIPDMMGGGDLDGDEYWICWDQRLIPRVDYPHLDRSSVSSTSRPQPERRLENLTRDLIDTFVNQRGGMLLGFLCNQWLKDAPCVSGLASHALCLGMVPFIEEAMDIVKTGRPIDEVKRNFFSHLNRFKEIKRGDDILEDLREMVPSVKHAKMAEVENAFVPDEDILAERRQNAQQFDEEFRMAGKYCSDFGRELMIAIDQDKRNSNSDESLMEQERPTFSSWTENRSQIVVSAWKKRHFSATTRAGQARESIKAAAWYEYGYKYRKERFPWLGAVYLNAIKAEATLGGRKAPAVGTW